jgi:hypothetical protein
MEGAPRHVTQRCNRRPAVFVRAPTPVDTLTSVWSFAALARGTSGVANNLGLTSVPSGLRNGAALTTSSQTHDVFGNVATTVGPPGPSRTTAYLNDAATNRRRLVMSRHHRHGRWVQIG